ncbi:MAG: hypothetical protein M1817_006685 [Caeruleum heppii]|nr:MAG: hypothetical protein M1817_006685 [Caeruleum heppii]
MSVASPLHRALTSTGHAEPSKTKHNSSDRNILRVVLGDLLFDTWYESFYPEELVNGGKHEVERLYVCRWCFKYSKELMPYMAHVKSCSWKARPPPGCMIYEKDCYSIHEVDGEDLKIFCQNLSLFAKLFLENKSVCYDLASFHYYLLVHTVTSGLTSPPSDSSTTRQVVGFFSKEKMSWDNNNLACILVFPPWQRKGLGKILMGISYEISKRENRIGGPEKPLSDLGKRGYLSFWSASIARFVLTLPVRKATTVQMVSKETFILPEDIITTLKEMNVHSPTRRADGTVVLNKGRIRAWASRNGLDLRPVVDPNAFSDEWVPVCDRVDTLQ